MKTDIRGFIDWYFPSPEDFVSDWLQQMAGAMGRGGWRKGAYRIRDVRACCQELIRLGDEMDKEMA